MNGENPSINVTNGLLKYQINGTLNNQEKLNFCNETLNCLNANKNKKIKIKFFASIYDNENNLFYFCFVYNNGFSIRKKKTYDTFEFNFQSEKDLNPITYKPTEIFILKKEELLPKLLGILSSNPKLNIIKNVAQLNEGFFPVGMLDFVSDDELITIFFNCNASHMVFNLLRPYRSAWNELFETARHEVASFNAHPKGFELNLEYSDEFKKLMSFIFETEYTFIKKLKEIPSPLQLEDNAAVDVPHTQVIKATTQKPALSDGMLRENPNFDMLALNPSTTTQNPSTSTQNPSNSTQDPSTSTSVNNDSILLAKFLDHKGQPFDIIDFLTRDYENNFQTYITIGEFETLLNLNFTLEDIFYGKIDGRSKPSLKSCLIYLKWYEQITKKKLSSTPVIRYPSTILPSIKKNKKNQKNQKNQKANTTPKRPAPPVPLVPPSLSNLGNSPDPLDSLNLLDPPVPPAPDLLDPAGEDEFQEGEVEHLEEEEI